MSKVFLPYLNDLVVDFPSIFLIIIRDHRIYWEYRAVPQVRFN